MKNITYSLFLFLFIFSSCNKDEDVLPSATAKKVSSTEVITPTTPLPFITKFDLEMIDGSVNGMSINSKSSTINKRSSALADWTVVGPFTKTGQLRKMLSDHKVTILSSQIYAPATYICDVYVNETTVNLNPGQFMMFDGASKTGYSNYADQTQGVVNSQTNNTYRFYTYSVVPKYDMAGRYIYKGTLPQDLTGTTYTYSYMENR